MSKKDNDGVNGALLNSVNRMNDPDSEKSDETEEALRAIQMASNMMDAIMAGRQLDLAFYGFYANHTIKRVRKARKRTKANKKK